MNLPEKPIDPTGAPPPIASVTLAVGGGRLGMRYCPGRVEGGLSTDSPHARMLEDLRAIRDWGAEALVSLMPDEELRRLGGGLMGQETTGAGMLWLHLPIVDMDTPSWPFEHRWVYAGTRLRAMLRRGGQAMLHCRAGLGRTGTVAARLLVELGVPPAEAVAQVRHARPGAIQTTAQEQYVMAQKRVSERGDRNYSRRLASLLGGAVGDAFGFSQPAGAGDESRRALRQPVMSNGQLRVSDDTQMSLFTLEGLVRAVRARRSDQDELLRQMRLSWLDWLQTQGRRSKLIWHASHLLKHASLHARRQPGLTNLQALERGATGTPEQPVNDCQACGGLQRVAPIGLLPGLGAEAAFDLAVRAAACTHGHPNAYLPAGVLAALLAELSLGEAMGTALNHALDLLRGRSHHGDTLAALDLALQKSSQTHFGRSARGLPPALWAPGTLSVGLYAALVGRDLHEVLHLACDPQHGSDSAAAIAGQIHGAQHGIEALPHDWVQHLDVFDATCELLHWATPVLRRRT
jgi:ADP-ribosylglycohydrolase